MNKPAIIECNGARFYKGIVEPKCNGGYPCLICQVIWAEAEARRLRRMLDEVRGIRACL